MDILDTRAYYDYERHCSDAHLNGTKRQNVKVRLLIASMPETYHNPTPHQEVLHAHDHHDPHTPHAHHPPTTYETANKHHFNATAHQYDDHPGAQKAAEKIGRAMKDTGLFKQGMTTVMDFACGTGELAKKGMLLWEALIPFFLRRLSTGLISRVLAAEDPKSIVGVDISQGMVDQYNKIVSDHGIPPEEMRAICATLPDEQLQGMTFDVIVVSTYPISFNLCLTSISHSVRLLIIISPPSTR